MIANLLEGPWGIVIKIFGPILLAVGIFASGYFIGIANEKTTVQTKIVKQVETQIKIVPLETHAIDLATANTQAKHDEAHNAIQKLPDNTVCDLPADTVRLLNANRGALPPVK